MRILMMGTSNFALPSLEKLTESNYNILGLVTQVDKPKERGRKVQYPPTKTLALRKNIPVWQFESIKEQRAFELISNLNLDLIVVVAYGQIIPNNILLLPKFGCINLHASLLPKYRGAAPINWALVNGEKITGNTVAWITNKLDSGDIILQEEYKITPYDNFGVLHDILATKGAILLLKAIELINNNQVHCISQDESQVSYAPSFNKNELRINWNQSSKDIHNFAKGFSPKPGAFTYLNNKILKILDTVPSSQLILPLKIRLAPPGTIISINKEGFIIITKPFNDNQIDFILVTQVQLENCKPMTASQFLRGHRIEIGIRLGGNQ
ncbi:MAG: methionyl-tRNA formyltransferase [bacterium]|nr:methionyl-tRNA formyltransferase [bacterium]